ncbi:MAG TPA: cation diffusion facilitator family transporter [Nitrospiraceae bacterium]|nr:cation diffusion facilitator family transporter [Nitrospiraceae bacterium]
MPDLRPSYTQLKHRLHIALALNAVIILAEFVGGLLFNSIGLMSDAGHNLIDQGSLFLALYAHMLSARPATEARTFGYHRAGIVAAFTNSFVLLITAAAIGVLAARRILAPIPVAGGWVIVIALLSFAANLSIALLLQQGAREDLNIRSAFWHMLGDAWVSLGVVASGAAIVLTGWSVLDPLVSLVIVGVIVKGAWPIFRESLEVLLESTPPSIKTVHVVEAIEKIPGVKNVHDLHIWAVEPRLVMLTCHVTVDGDDSQLTNELLRTIRARVAAEFSIKHLTIQMETQCCHPDVMHCDLSQLAASHSPAGIRNETH